MYVYYFKFSVVIYTYNNSQDEWYSRFHYCTSFTWENFRKARKFRTRKNYFRYYDDDEFSSTILIAKIYNFSPLVQDQASFDLHHKKVVIIFQYTTFCTFLRFKRLFYHQETKLERQWISRTSNFGTWYVNSYNRKYSQTFHAKTCLSCFLFRFKLSAKFTFYLLFWTNLINRCYHK